MLLSILISALTSRREQRLELERSLQTQIVETSGGDTSGGVEVLVLEDQGQTPNGSKRNTLTQMARGRYIAFVDDDDKVADDYISQLLAAIVHDPDVVTFLLLCDRGDGKSEVWDLCTTETAHPPGSPDHLRMSANHLCAWRRGLAIRVPWCPIRYMDDIYWHHGMIASGLVKTERHIPRVLYHYLFRPNASAAQTPDLIRATRAWARGGVAYYWWNDRIVLAPAAARPRGGLLEVIAPGGGVEQAPPEALKIFHLAP